VKLLDRPESPVQEEDPLKTRLVARRPHLVADLIERRGPIAKGGDYKPARAAVLQILCNLVGLRINYLLHARRELALNDAGFYVSPIMFLATVANAEPQEFVWQTVFPIKFYCMVERRTVTTDHLKKSLCQERFFAFGDGASECHPHTHRRQAALDRLVASPVYYPLLRHFKFREAPPIYLPRNVDFGDLNAQGFALVIPCEIRLPFIATFVALVVTELASETEFLSE
jgi:hypothetical protein